MGILNILFNKKKKNNDLLKVVRARKMGNYESIYDNDFLYDEEFSEEDEFYDDDFE